MKRFRVAAGILAAAAVLGVGCSRETAAVSEKAPVLSVESAAPSAPASTVPAVEEAKLAAIEFLDKLGSKKTQVVDRVAISFRKEVSGPSIYEDERRLGYSNSDTLSFLSKQFEGVVAAPIRGEARSPSGREAVFHGNAQGKGRRSFRLWLAKDGNAWLVTYFEVTDAIPMAMPTDKVGAELAWARETAIGFLESLLGGDHDYVLTMSMMTDALKKRLPSPSVHDTGLEYSKKDVRNWLNAARNGVTEFAIGTQALDGNTATFDGELNGNGRHRPFRLTLARADDKWKVDALDLRQ